MLCLQRSKLINEPTLIQKISLGLLASVSSKVRNDTDPFPLVDVTAPSSLASESLKNSDSWRVTPTQILTYKVFFVTSVPLEELYSLIFRERVPAPQPWRL